MVDNSKGDPKFNSFPSRLSILVVKSSWLKSHFILMSKDNFSAVVQSLSSQ